MYAVLPHPFSVVKAALVLPRQWCDVLILHLNVKRCAAGGDRIVLYLGRKYAQPIEQAYRLQFSHAVAADTDDYLHVRMEAPSGPMGTRDYVIELEATPLPPARTFLHFSYTVGHGTLSAFAMQTYLNTIGSGKIGFSSEGTQPVRGMRGAMERNAMRYYLAIAVYLDSLQLPESKVAPQLLEEGFSERRTAPFKRKSGQCANSQSDQHPKWRGWRLACVPLTDGHWMPAWLPWPPQRASRIRLCSVSAGIHATTCVRSKRQLPFTAIEPTPALEFRDGTPGGAAC